MDFRWESSTAATGPWPGRCRGTPPRHAAALAPGSAWSGPLTCQGARPGVLAHLALVRAAPAALVAMQDPLGHAALVHRGGAAAGVHQRAACRHGRHRRWQGINEVMKVGMDTAWCDAGNGQAAWQSAATGGAARYTAEEPAPANSNSAVPLPTHPARPQRQAASNSGIRLSAGRLVRPAPPLAAEEE